MAQITWEDDEIKKPATVITWEDEEPTAAAPPPEPAPAIQPQPGLMDSIGNMAGNVGQALQGLIPTSIPTPAPQTMPVTPIVPQRSASEEIYYPEGLQPPAGAESPFTQPTVVGGPSREAGTFAERAGQKLYTAADVAAHGIDPIFHGAGLLKTVAQMGRMLSENMTVPVGENLTRLTGVNINPTQKWKDIETYMSDVQQKRMGGIEGSEKEWVDAIQSAANNALMMVVATPMAGTMAKLGMLGEAGAAALKAGKSFIPTTLVLSMMGAQKAGEDYARGRKENMTPLTAAGMGIWGALNEVIPELGPQYMLGKLIPGADAVFKSSAPMQKIANWMAKFAVAEQGEEQLTNVMDNIKEVFLNTKEAQNYALENPEFAQMSDAEKVMYMTQKQFLPTVFQTAVSSLLLGGFGRAYGNAMQKSMEKEYYSTTPLYRVPADYLGTEEYATASTAFQSQPEVLERFLDQKMEELVEKWNTYNPEKKTTWAFIKDQMTNDMTNLAMEQMRQARIDPRQMGEMAGTLDVGDQTFQGWQQQTNAGWTRGVESPIDRGANQQMRRETTAAAEGTKPQAPPTETIVPTAPAVKVEPTKPAVKQREPQYEARLQEIRDNGLDSVNKIKKFYAERNQFYSNADARRMRYEAFGKEPTAQMQKASEQVAGAITTEDLAETARPLPTKAELDLGTASEQVASGMSEEELAATAGRKYSVEENDLIAEFDPETYDNGSYKGIPNVRIIDYKTSAENISKAFGDKPVILKNINQSRADRIAIVTQTPKKGLGYQVTVFDKTGPLYDDAYQTRNEAIERAIREEFQIAGTPADFSELTTKTDWTRRAPGNSKVAVSPNKKDSVERAGDKVDVSEQGDLLSKPLENRTRNIAGTTFVRAVDDRNVVIKLGNGQILKIDESNKTLETDIKGRRIKGYFEEIDGEGVIKLAQNAQTGSTLDHELFHAAFLMALNPKERETILNDFKDAEDPQEAAAIHYEKRKYLDGTLAGSKYLRKMADFFSDLARNWLGYTSTRNTMRAIAKGEPFARKEIQSRADLTEPKGVKERLGEEESNREYSLAALVEAGDDLRTQMKTGTMKSEKGKKSTGRKDIGTGKYIGKVLREISASADRGILDVMKKSAGKTAPKMKGIPEGIAEEGKVKQWYPQGIANLEARGNDTQRVNTYTTYEKMAQLIPNIESAEGLDVGAGLHVGASLLTSKYGANLETVEPEPAVNEQGPLVSPDYSYSSQVETKSKDYIVSNQVLNVLEPEIRDGVVDDIGRILKDGGVAIISARGFSGDIDASVKNPNNKPVTDGTDAGKAVWVRKTDRDAKGNPIPGQYKYDYQRGFDGNELVNYIQERLGTDFEVKKQSGLGKAGVVIRKKSAKQKVVKGKVRMMVDEFIASEGGFARLDLGLGDLFGKNAREDKIVDKLLQETDIDPEFEKRRAAARGITPPSLFNKFKENAVAFYKQMTQHFSTLDFKKHASLGNSLRVLESGGDISSGMAYRAILGFTKGLTPAEYKIFEDNIILPDLIRNIEKDLYNPASLPFDADYTNLKEIVRLRDPQTLLNTASRQLAAGTITREEFDDATAGIQKVADALAERNAFMGDLRDRLVDAGFLPSSVRNDDRYFHRQVLEHYNVKAAAEKGATGAEVKNPKYGMMKARTGSIKEYNQNYLESEREVLSQMINTMRTYDFLQKKVKALDVSARVRQFAMDNNISVDEAMKDPQFKDYVRWSPEKGDKFYKATSVSEDVLDDLLNSAIWNASGDMTVDVDALDKLERNVRTVLAKRPAEMWIIPADVAATLDAFSMPKAKSTVIEQAAQATRSMWKGAAIMGPLRAIPYMINNAVGDADIVIAYNTAIFKKVPEAMNILWNADYKNARYQEAMNQAVIDSGSSAQELADISKDAAFSYIQGNGISLNVVKNYQQAISNLNKFRENTLRLAAYLHFVEQTEAGKTGIYAASDMGEIDQITDPKERAAKLARDLMVDYGNTSEVGNVIAKYMIPFYRWMEGNAPRYYRLLKNAPFEGNSGARILAAAGTKAGMKLAWTFLKYNVISQVLYRLWHAAISGDDDDETAKARAISESKGTQQWVLGKTISRFLFPNDIDEVTRSLRMQGAFGDVVKTFTGSDNWVDDLADLYYGSTTYGQKAKELGLAPKDWLDLLNAPVIKGYASASFPFTKMFAEQAMGKQFNRGNWNFKDMRPMRDRAAAVAGNMGVAPIYERLAGIPRAGSVGIGEALTYKTNLGEVAYNETRNLVKDFMESKGVPASFGAEPRESDNAWYNYKRAQKLYQQTNDPAEKTRHLEEIRRYFGEYQNLKAQEQAVLGKRLKPSDIKKKLEKASENADPLAQLPKKLRPAFIESLSKNDKDKLKEAIKYYNQTLRR